MAERKRAIQADMMLSIIRKCDLMDVSRSAMYYQPVERELDLEELEIKKEMDKFHIKYPFMGSPDEIISFLIKSSSFDPPARKNLHSNFELSFSNNLI